MSRRPIAMDETEHFAEMLRERGISREWVDLTVSRPDDVEDHQDGTRHFLKQIREHGNRWLRVVVNVAADKDRAVTAFFDRRMRKER